MYTGFIYQIVADDTDKVYYGSTIQALNKRFISHKTNFNKFLKEQNNPYLCHTASVEIFKYPNARIELIETYINDNKDLLKHKLRDIESEYIIRCREIKPNTCTNHVIPNRTHKQYQIDNRNKQKQYRINNADKIKQYRIDNHDKQKEYYDANVDKIREQKRLYYLAKKQLNKIEMI